MQQVNRVMRAYCSWDALHCLYTTVLHTHALYFTIAKEQKFVLLVFYKLLRPEIGLLPFTGSSAMSAGCFQFGKRNPVHVLIISGVWKSGVWLQKQIKPKHAKCRCTQRYLTALVGCSWSKKTNLSIAFLKNRKQRLSRIKTAGTVLPPPWHYIG